MAPLRPSSRRSPRTWRRLGASGGIVARELTGIQPGRGPEPAAALFRVSRRAMACQFEIFVPAGRSGAVMAAEAALEAIDQLEAQMTVYRPESEVSRLNATAAARPVRVERRLFELFELAARLCGETEGAFDITAGALIKAWGFFRGPKRIPEPAELAAALDRVGMRHVELDRQQRTVRFHRPGLEINLGAVGKGYALDRVIESLRRTWGLGSALIHAGHSSIYALGAPAHDPHGWTVGIRHPFEAERRIALVRVRNQAIGTSAASFQYFEAAGRRLGHLLDPRRGWPAEGMASVSVVAPTAAEADALATAFFILGVDRARAYCQAHPDVGAVLVPLDESDEPMPPIVVGLSDSEVELCPWHAPAVRGIGPGPEY